MKSVVWITDGTSLVRCAVQHPRSLPESENIAVVLTGRINLMQHHVWDLVFDATKSTGEN